MCVKTFERSLNPRRPSLPGRLLAHFFCLSGFHELVPPELISIFTPKELELLISGLPDVDLDDLQVHTFVRGPWAMYYFYWYICVYIDRFCAVAEPGIVLPSRRLIAALCLLAVGSVGLITNRRGMVLLLTVPMLLLLYSAIARS